LIFKKLKELIRKRNTGAGARPPNHSDFIYYACGADLFLSLALQGVYVDKISGRKILLVLENASHTPKAVLLEKKISAAN